MIPPQAVGDALDELGVCLWDSRGTLRSTLDVWGDVRERLALVDDEERRWFLLSVLVGQVALDLRRRGFSFGHALYLLGFLA